MNILDKEDRQVSLPINPDGRQVNISISFSFYAGNGDDVVMVILVTMIVKGRLTLVLSHAWR